MRGARIFNREAAENLAAIGRPSVNLSFEDGDSFSAGEVRTLQGKAVVAKAGGFVAAGTTGHIVEPRRAPGGWLIVVEWSDDSTDVFSKKDARNSLAIGKDL